MTSSHSEGLVPGHAYSIFDVRNLRDSSYLSKAKRVKLMVGADVTPFHSIVNCARVLSAGCWVLGAGCWVLGAECWVLM